MAIDFRDYNDPGVYVEIVDNPVTVSPGVEPTIVAFVGTSPDSKTVNESFNMPSVGQKTLTEEGTLPETVAVSGSRADATYTSGALAKTTTEFVVSPAVNIEANLDVYVDYLPSGTYPVLVGSETVARTLTVAGVDVATNTLSRGTTSWKLSGTADTIPVGSVINLSTTYVPPTYYVGQTGSPLVGDGMYADADAVHVAAFPEIAASDLAVVTFDQEVGRVVKIAKDLGTDEIQSLELTDKPDSGTFTITFDGDTTTALDYNATEAVVQAALELLPSIGTGNVTVARTGDGSATAYKWTLTFAGYLANKQLDEITAAEADPLVVLPATPAATITIATEQQGGTETPTDFTLTFEGATTSVLNNDATAADILAAIEALTTVDAGDFAVVGGPMNTSDVFIRYIGSKYLPYAGDADKTAKALLANTRDFTSSTAPIIDIQSATTDGTDDIDAGDVLEVNGERWLVLSTDTTVMQLSPVTGVGNTVLVQRGFQNTYRPAREHNQYQKIFKVSSLQDGAFIGELNADFAVKVDPGADANPATLDDNLIIIKVVSDGVTTPRFNIGTGYQATMSVTDTTYYTPKHYTRDDDVYNDFGNPFKENSSEINSELSLAAQLAFANGANEIVLVAVNPDETGTDIGNWQAAIDRLDAEPTVNTIVPLLDMNSAIGDELSVYIQDKNNNIIADGILRRAFFGFDSLLNYYTSTDYTTAATGWRDTRVSLVSPGYGFVANKTNTDSKVPGYFVAAAVASRQASLSPQEPLTRKQIYGFTAIESLDFASILDMQAGGVLVVWQDRVGRLIIKHGLTTDMESAYTREISVVTSRDRLRDLIFTTLDEGELIGSAMTSRTPDMVLAGVSGALEEAVGLNLIYGYGDIQYRVNPIEPTAIEVRFAYRPTLPLNYIVVEFSIDTALGTLDFQTISQSTQ